MSDTEKPSWEWQQEVERLTNELTSAEMRSVAHLKMYDEASHQLAAKDATIQETVMLYQSRIDTLNQQLSEMTAETSGGTPMTHTQLRGLCWLVLLLAVIAGIWWLL